MSHEHEYFQALKVISQFKSPEWLQKHSERFYGLSYHEALEMAYENIISNAAFAIKGRREPPTIKARE